MTGNWQIQATAKSGSLPFSTLSGYVNELAVVATAHQTNAAFRVQSTGCITDTVVPMSGNVQQPNVNLSSFEIEGQTLTLTATKDLAATTLSGTYQITGGCGNGESGTIAGSKYASLSGDYSGTLASDPTKKLALNLSQFTDGTGQGTFLVTGSAAITGFSCFSSGSLVADGSGYVSGSTAVLNFTTNDAAGAQLKLAGTFDTAAKALTISSIQVTSGSCAGSYGNAILAQ